MREDSNGYIYWHGERIAHRFQEHIQVYFPDVLDAVKEHYPDCFVEVDLD